MALAQSHPDDRIRMGLLAASKRMSDGQETFGALRAEKLISSRESTALALTDSSRAHAWMLRQFAMRRWEQAQGRRLWIARIASVVSTCFLGLIVSWTAIAVLMTLFSLIAGLA